MTYIQQARQIRDQIFWTGASCDPREGALVTHQVLRGLRSGMLGKGRPYVGDAVALKNVDSDGDSTKINHPL